MREPRISAGDYELNRILHGGYESDIITTIYGPGGSGKTNLCMILAVSQAKKGNKVIYIDTEGGFSIDRVKQLLYGKTENLNETLENILLLKPTSFEEQNDAFQKMLASIKKDSISLIIIDSIAMLYRLELGDAIQTEEPEKIREVNRKLANQLRALAEISRKQNIPVVITNQVYSKFIKNDEDKAEKIYSMVGGDLLKYWSKCIIELTNFRGRRKLTLKKHRSLPEKSLDFEITNEGIKKKGWI